jgi:cytochrome c oxidase subunit 2
MPRQRLHASRVIPQRLPIILILTLGICGLVISADAREPAIPQVYVHARKFSFTPAEITLKKGRTVRLVLISEDVTHGLTVTGLNIQAEIMKGHRTEVLVTPTEVGDFPGSCSVYCGSGHRDMEFMVHVVE